MLNRLMERARDLDLIEGFEIGRDRIKLSHLQFADDTIFFLSSEKHNIKNVLDILKVFGLVSGLRLNLAKSSIVGINLNEEEMAELEREAGCGAGSWPMSYLGMPLGDNPIRVGFWDPVIEKISIRLSSWFKGCLSRGGRLTLIQSVLESIPIYYLSLFKAPISVCNHIESLLRKFFWEGVEEGKKDHLLGWDIVSRSKSKGGLGIGNISKRNEALLGKWLWRFPLEQESFWCSIIRSKYGLNDNGWDSNLVSRGTFRNPWKAISNGLDSFKGLIRLRVGKGNKTRFWEDAWVGTSPLCFLFPGLYRIACDQNCLIESVVDWNSSHSISWNISFRRNLQDRDFQAFLDLLNIINGVSFDKEALDKRVWVGGNSGQFSCKSYFDLLINSSDLSSFEPYKSIWKTGIPPKVKIFAWMAAWRRVNTCDVLQSRRPNRALSPSWCILCRQDAESVDHLIIRCRFSQIIWDKIKWELHLISALPNSWHALLCMEWHFRGNRKKAKILWRCCIMAAAWCLWLERNRRTFEDKFSEIEEIWCRIKSLASLWASTANAFSSFSISDISVNWSAVMS